MPQHQYEQLLVKRGHLNYSWDEMFAAGYGIDDLDHVEIMRTVNQGIKQNRIYPFSHSESIENILGKLGLSINRRLTNAAVVLFAKDVRPNYPQCQIKMARFRGVEKLSGFMDSKIVYGNAFTILDEASLFLQRNLSVASFFQENSFVRIDKPDLPILAIREALINALCHRDYSNRSSTITMAIFEDKLEIWSEGNLPEGIKIDDLKKRHPSKQRNKLISDIIYRRGLVEKWGTGTLTMIDLCKEHGVKEPEFEEYSGGFSVTFSFKPSKEIANKVDFSESASVDKLNVRQRKIYNLLKDQGPLSPKDIIFKLDESIPERTLRLDLATLKDLSLLESTGQTVSTLWFVKEKRL